MMPPFMKVFPHFGQHLDCTKIRQSTHPRPLTKREQIAAEATPDTFSVGVAGAGLGAVSVSMFVFVGVACAWVVLGNN